MTNGASVTTDGATLLCWPTSSALIDAQKAQRRGQWPRRSRKGRYVGLDYQRLAVPGLLPEDVERVRSVQRVREFDLPLIAPTSSLALNVEDLPGVRPSDDRVVTGLREEKLNPGRTHLRCRPA